jgi:hypothetical protein
MMAVKRYYIKERQSLQTGTYYVACGQLSKTAAKKKESALYGFNIMHGFDTEAEYNAQLEKLRANGERVHIN